MTRRDDVFDKVAGAIGDFGSPFYAEERQRDVWNESSAVGFQAMLWGTTALACAMAWIGGAGQAGWAIALLVIAGVASWITLGHARRHGITGLEDARMLRLRVGLWLGLYLVTVVGIAYRLIRGQDAGDSATGVVVGMVIGVVLGLVAFILGAGRRGADHG